MEEGTVELPAAPAGTENLGELLLINRFEGPHWLSIVMALAVFCFFTALMWPTIKEWM